MKHNLDSLRKKLLYRSMHRGCKEIDIIIGLFVKEQIANLTDQDVLELESLLDVDDGVLYHWFTGQKEVANEFNTTVFQKIYDFNKTKHEA